MGLRLLPLAIFFLFWSGEKPIIPPPQSPPFAKKLGGSTVASQDTLQKLKLMFAGDIMSQLPQIESARTEVPGQYDFSECFQYIRPVLEEADVAIGNLEFTMPGTPPYTGYPQFRTPDDMAPAIKEGGFDILVGANNHANDSGWRGVEHTIEAVSRNGFLHTGTFYNQQERDVFYPMIFYKKGFKIALVNYTHHTNGIKTTPPVIVNRLEMDVVKRDLETAKAMKPDVIIAFLHWGDEHQLYENANQRGVARLLHQWGADMVIGSHPHVVQPIKSETIRGSSKKYLTAYSLGNFVSSQPFPHTEGGIILEVNLEKKNKETTIGETSYIPVFRYDPLKDGKRHFFIVPISRYEDGREGELGMSQYDINKMNAFSQNTRERLNSFGAVERVLRLKE